jgi:NRPS condensation-like uncharacterized protein
MPETTPRAIRVPDDVWRAAIAKAREEGTTVTAVVLAALRRFIKKEDPQ